MRQCSFLLFLLFIFFWSIPPSLFAAKIPVQKGVVPVIDIPTSFPEWRWNFVAEEEVALAQDKVTFDLNQELQPRWYQLDSFIRKNKTIPVQGYIAKVPDIRTFAANGDTVVVNMNSSVQVGDKFLATLSPLKETAGDESYYIYTIQVELEITRTNSPDYNLPNYYEAKINKTFFPVTTKSLIVKKKWKKFDINRANTSATSANGKIFKISGLLKEAVKYGRLYFTADFATEGSTLNVYQSRDKSFLAGQIYVVDWDAKGKVGTAIVLWTNTSIYEGDIIK